MISVISVCAQADYQSGLDAYEVGHYKKAMQEWKAVAENPPSDLPPPVLAETLYAIAGLYWEGQGASRDYFQARQWLERAAEKGHAGAMSKLGYLYTDGISVEQNFGTAFEYFSQAARLGDVDGLYNLGVFYLNGWGTQQDVTMAKQYLAAAGAQGDEAAEQALQHVIATQQEQGVEDPSTSSAVSSSHTESKTGGQSQHTDSDPGLETAIHDESWLLAQNPDHYAIQAIGLSNREKLEELVSGHEVLAPFAFYTVQLSNGLLYVLVQGDYATVEEARAVQARFPASINMPERVWVRKFRGIQAIIRGEQGP